jgi:hypothetical protein
VCLHFPPSSSSSSSFILSLSLSLTWVPALVDWGHTLLGHESTPPIAPTSYLSYAVAPLLVLPIRYHSLPLSSTKAFIFYLFYQYPFRIFTFFHQFLPLKFKISLFDDLGFAQLVLKLAPFIEETCFLSFKYNT